MASVAIRAQNLSKSFGEGDALTLAVRNVSFDAYFGEILFVVGPSGSGKTTMLSMISGILRPSEGKVEIEGTDIWHLSSDELRNFGSKSLALFSRTITSFPGSPRRKISRSL